MHFSVAKCVITQHHSHTLSDPQDAESASFPKVNKQLLGRQAHQWESHTQKGKKRERNHKLMRKGFSICCKKSTQLDMNIITRKKATWRCPLSEANWTAVQPVESVARRSAKLPACTSTVHASKLPRIAAQCNGVQPDNSTSHHLFSIIFSQLVPSTT
jgi:hypothetical protein